MSVPPKQICSFKAIKVLSEAFVGADKLIIKFIWKCEKPTILSLNGIKKSEFGGQILPGFTTYYKTMTIKTVWCQH